MFELVSKLIPSGDQPKAIEELVNGINSGKKHQVLLGATGTGKTSRRGRNEPQWLLWKSKTWH